MFIVFGVVRLFRASGGGLQHGYVWYLPAVALSWLAGALVARFVSNPCERALRAWWAVAQPLRCAMANTLASNSELYAYLLSLKTMLEENGAFELASVAEHASRHAAGMSTEFLGEARIALRRVYSDNRNGLTDVQKAFLHDVIVQLDAAFDGRR
jgi:hypothetical protein